jgi:hypothetical protein
MDALVAVMDEDSKLEGVLSSFYRVFSKGEHFNVGCTLSILLNENVLSHALRLVALSILFDLHKTEPLQSHPFLPAFVNTITSQNVSNTEKDFVLKLVKGSKEVRRYIVIFWAPCRHLTRECFLPHTDCQIFCKRYIKSFTVSTSICSRH